MNAERRERMTETFVAVRDALERAAVAMFPVVMEQMPDRPRPTYLPEIPPPSKAAARVQMDALIAKGRRRKP